MKNTSTFLMVALFQVFGGGILAGCEGGDNSQILSDAGTAVGTGLTRTDAGLVICSIPSPTGDEKSPYGIGRNTPYYFVVTNDVKAECESFKKLPPKGWESLAAGLNCSDPANDFQGTSGISWCISTSVVGINSTGRSPEPDTTSNCVGSSSSTQTSESTTTCQVSGMGQLVTVTNGNGSFPMREFAGCSTAGVFVGWICVYK